MILSGKKVTGQKVSPTESSKTMENALNITLKKRTLPLLKNLFLKKYNLFYLKEKNDSTLQIEKRTVCGDAYYANAVERDLGYTVEKELHTESVEHIL